MKVSAKIDRVTVELIDDGLDPYAIAAALVIRGAAALSFRFKVDVVLQLIENAMKKRGAAMSADQLSVQDAHLVAEQQLEQVVSGVWGSVQ